MIRRMFLVECDHCGSSSTVIAVDETEAMRKVQQGKGWGLMTIRELKQQLDHFPDDAQVIFTPDDYCGEGYPEWERCSVTDHMILDDQDRDIPSGDVIIELKGERG